MANDKRKNNKKENDMEFISKFSMEAMLALAAWAVIVFLSLSASLASYGERLRNYGHSEGEIFKAKFWRLVGLLPFALVLAYFVAQSFPKNISIKNMVITKSLDGVPTTETEYREIVEDTKSKIESTETAARMAGYGMESSYNESRDALREYKRAKTVEEKSEIDERSKRIEKDWKESRDTIDKSKKSIPELRQKLAIARADLEAFRNGKPTSFDKLKSATALESFSEEQENSNKGKFLWYGFLFIGISLPLSYPMVYFTRSRHERLKRLQTFARWLDPITGKIAYAVLIPIGFLGRLVGVKREEAVNKPSSVMQVGYERNAFLTDKNLNYHTQIIGGSGAGKTNLLKVMLEDRMAKGHSIIFFDFKADIELMDWMAGASEQYSRVDDLVILSMSDPKLSYAYNPIKHGSETEISSQIMNSLTWSEPFYQSKSEGALLVILKALCYQRDMGGRDFHLGDLYQFLNDPSFRMDIVSNVSSLNYPEIHRGDLKRICEELTVPNKKENFNSLITQISKILNSSAGDIVVHKIGNDEEFEFREVMETGKIAYLFMNSLKLKDTASIMGKLMLQDLMKAVGNIYDDRNAIKHPTTLIIDEFASFATPDFGEFIEKARGAGISIVIAYQSRKSLDHIEDNLAIKVNENTANKIVFQVQDSEDVEWFCSLLGTKKTTKETYQAEDGFFGDTKTGMKSVREVEEYVIHPNQIKNLKLGQALLYCSKVDRHHAIMNIKRANPFIGRYERKSVPNQNLAKVNLIKIGQTKENETEANNYF